MRRRRVSETPILGSHRIVQGRKVLGRRSVNGDGGNEWCDFVDGQSTARLVTYAR